MHDYTKSLLEFKGIDRFVKGLYEKYRSLSKFSGFVKINNITKEEARDLSNIFGKKYDVGSNVTINVNKFITIMSNSRFIDFDINTFVSEYLGVSLITKKEEKNAFKDKEYNFYMEFVDKCSNIGEKWLKEVISKNIMPYQIIHRRYNKNKEELNDELQIIIKSLNNLPTDNVKLSIFAANNATDPHYYDFDSNHLNLLLYGLSYLLNVDFPNNREEKISLLQQFNIEVDNVSNFVITYNLLSDNKLVNEFSENNQSLILNTNNIVWINNFKSINNKVFVVENPSVLEKVIYDELKVSVIVSGGFLNSCVYKLLDKLIESGSTIYYNGDFDPEGLIIADRLKKKYKDNLVLFGYDFYNYNEDCDGVKISKSRLKKLDLVTCEELQFVKKKILESEYAIYQENNLSIIMGSICDIINMKEVKINCKIKK